MASNGGVVYADASALVKLAIREPESDALRSYVREKALATSRIALVEVPRAASLADATPETFANATRIVDECLLIDVTDSLLRDAAVLATRRLRTLEAMHLASAQRVEAAEMVVYDHRLAEAAREAGLATAAPGAT